MSNEQWLKDLEKSKFTTNFLVQGPRRFLMPNKNK